MKKFNKYFLIIIAIFILISLFSSFALSQLTLEELLSEADVIAYVHVVSAIPRDTLIEPFGKRLYTITQFKILQTIKGSVGTDEYIWPIVGGKIGNHEEWVEPSPPRFETNENAILYLQRHPGIPGEPLVPIQRSGNVTDGKIYANGSQRVEINRYVNILKKAITDRTVLSKFYEELNKEEAEEKEARNQLLSRNAKSGQGDPNDIPVEIRIKMQSKIDSIKNAQAIQRAQLDELNIQRDKEARRKWYISDSIENANKPVAGKSKTNNLSEDEIRKRIKMQDSIDRMRDDAFSPPRGGESWSRKLSKAESDSIKKEWLKEKKKGQRATDTISSETISVKKRLFTKH